MRASLPGFGHWKFPLRGLAATEGYKELTIYLGSV